MDIEGRKVLITGGSLGIGRRLALDFVGQGAQVLVCARDVDKLDELKQTSPDIAVFPCDVRSAESVTKFRERALETFGTPDILINNAAIFRRVDLLRDDTPVDAWLEEVDINLSGVLRITHAFLPHLMKLQTATIINLTSPSSDIPMTAAPFYSATKAAIYSWTVSLRHQLRGTAIRVIELNPPAVNTRMNKENPDVEGLKLWSTDEFAATVLRRLRKRRRNEILVGDAKLVRVMSRIAPDFVFNKMNGNAT